MILFKTFDGNYINIDAIAFFHRGEKRIAMSDGGVLHVSEEDRDGIVAIFDAMISQTAVGSVNPIVRMPEEDARKSIQRQHEARDLEPPRMVASGGAKPRKK